MSDWRITNQKAYLAGVHLLHKVYEPRSMEWDHDHCAFCLEKFPDEHQIGYCTPDEKHWLCERCFRDFSSEFGWQVDAEKNDDGEG